MKLKKKSKHIYIVGLKVKYIYIYIDTLFFYRMTKSEVSLSCCCEGCCLVELLL